MSAHTSDHFNFALLDRHWSSANATLFADGEVYGVNVARRYSTLCAWNLTPESAWRPAIKVAMTHRLPPGRATIATMGRRRNPDTFGAMALLDMRYGGAEITAPDVLMHIDQIARTDSPEADWRPGLSITTVSAAQALEVLVGDVSRIAGERVAIMRSFLETGCLPEPEFEDAAAAVRRARAEQLAVEPQVRVLPGGLIAVIESTSRYAVRVAKRHARIVIAVNPAYDDDVGAERPYRRITIDQVADRYVRLVAVRKDLSALDPNWRGDLTRIRSPQGRSTTLELEEIITVVIRHLR